MKIKSEFELIEKFKSAAGNTPQPPGLIEGIGDDCAVFSAGNGALSLITTDMSVENTHFTRGISTPFEAGWKCMTANLSDIAAMGGEPGYVFVSLGLPSGTDSEYAEELFRGLNECAALCGARVAGGDTVRSDIIVISVTIYGETGPDSLVTRKGARPGDLIFMTGCCGDSAAGLSILKSKGRDPGIYPSLLKKHLSPDPKPGVVETISKFKPTAMIDISDGLVSDLKRICEASGTGFTLNAEEIPISDELIKYCEETGEEPVEYALSGGEEYELIFTAGEDNSRNTPPGITKIGTITGNGFLISVNGETKDIGTDGFDHFSVDQNSITGER